MGTTLSGAIQVYNEAIPQYSVRAYWDTVSTWEFNKDYPLIQDLGEGNRRIPLDNDWPDDSKYSDCLQVFTPQELPVSDSQRYQAMQCAVNSLIRNGYNVRILFWRD